MGTFKGTALEMSDFLRLRNKRVRLELDTLQGLQKLVFYVSGREVGYMRRVLTEIVPLGVLVDVKRLRFWECRINKIQLPEGF